MPAYASLYFFFNCPPPTEISTLSLHDALPISPALPDAARLDDPDGRPVDRLVRGPDHRQREHPLRLDRRDRKSTRLNSSHRCISYAVFCLKKKRKNENELLQTHNKILLSHAMR